MILDVITDNPILVVIVAGEVGFWLLIGAGLVARYLLRAPALGAVLLAGTVLVDVVVLIATVLDLRGGAVANWSHGLAAAYIGVSVAFGRRMIRWADQHFAYRFAGGPVPDQPPKHGLQRVRYEWQQWARFALAWAIACGLLLTMIMMVDSPERTEQLWTALLRLTAVLIIWFVGWPLWASLAQPARSGGRP